MGKLAFNTRPNSLNCVSPTPNSVRPSTPPLERQTTHCYSAARKWNSDKHAYLERDLTVFFFLSFFLSRVCSSHVFFHKKRIDGKFMYRGKKIDALETRGIVESWKGGKWCRVKRRNRKIDICAYLVINGRKG